MNLATFNPEQALDRFFDTDRFFGFQRTHEEQPTVRSKVNVIEKDDTFHLEAETPGITQKDVSIEFHKEILTLKGSREESQQSDKSDYHIREFSNQSSSRSFRLSDQIDSEEVVASISANPEGHPPKKRTGKTKKIEVEVKPQALEKYK